jgi:acyl-coenzyme A synthetase/AMP-(fatty) acid ligase
MRGESFEAALRSVADRHPEKLLFTFAADNGRVSYGEFQRRVARCTAALVDAGVGPGIRVALRLSASPEFLVHLLAVMQAGGLAVPLANAQHPAMADSMLRVLDPHLIVVAAEGSRSTAGACPTEPRCKWDWHRDAPPSAETNEARLGIFTSGTTGVPRCVLLSRSNLLAGAVFVAEAHRLAAGDIALCLMPLTHINGIVTTVLAPLLTGGSVIFLEGVPSPRSFAHVLGQSTATWFSAAPMHFRLLSYADAKPRPFARCRFGRSASAALPVEVQRQFEELYGIPVIETMGLTECSGQVFANPMPPVERKFGSVGRAVGNVAEIIDENDRALPNGVVGEIRVKGPNVMLGYLGASADTAEILRGGWLYTGDLGFRDDDGFFHVTGRKKLIANIGGHKVSLVAVENAVARLDFLEEAVAVARPDKGFGEVVDLYYTAGVNLKPGASAVAAERIREAVATVLPHHLALRRIIRVKEIPRSASGKVLRHRLAELESAE